MDFPGRKKLKGMDSDTAEENVRGISKNVSERGIFKARTPEGKEANRHSK